MAKGKEYKILADRWVDLLLPVLNEHGSEGWGIVAYFQEHGNTKILLERDIP